MNILSATALFVGGLLTVQASANLQLTTAVGTPYGAATLQLWVAAGLLGLLAALVGGLPALTRVADVPWWFLLGGLASPLYITSITVSGPAVRTTVAIASASRTSAITGLAPAASRSRSRPESRVTAVTR